MGMGEPPPLCLQGGIIATFCIENMNNNQPILARELTSVIPIAIVRYFSCAFFLKHLKTISKFNNNFLTAKFLVIFPVCRLIYFMILLIYIRSASNFI